MDTVLRLGAVNLGQQDLVVARSVLKLRNNQWIWSETAQGADLWLVDVDRDGYAAALAGLERQRLVALAEQMGTAERFAHWLIKPLKAMHLMRLLDSVAKVLAPSTAPVAAPAPTAPPAEIAASPAEVAAPALDIAPPDAAGVDPHPWHGRKVMLAKAPNLAKFPVSAEMLPWLEALRRAPIGYEELLAALPMDVGMVDAILDDAAKAGQLRDGDGNTLAPLPRRGGGFWQRFKK